MISCFLSFHHWKRANCKIITLSFWFLLDYLWFASPCSPHRQRKEGVILICKCAREIFVRVVRQIAHMGCIRSSKPLVVRCVQLVTSVCINSAHTYYLMHQISREWREKQGLPKVVKFLQTLNNNSIFDYFYFINAPAKYEVLFWSFFIWSKIIAYEWSVLMIFLPMFQ